MSGDLEERLALSGSRDDIGELVDLGCDLADVNRHGDAERCFRRAADLGSAVAAFNLGNALAAQGRLEEAVTAYERALTGGETDAWLNLGTVLQDLGDLDGAMRAFRAASDVGDHNGALALASCLHEQGQLQQAMAAARDAAKEGNKVAAGVIACWQWDETLDPALESDLRSGMEHYPSARASLAELLIATGRVGEARAVLEQGANLGEEGSWLPLGNLYADELGDAAAAEAAYRSGIAAGDAYCHHNLGVLLENRGATQEAVAQFRLGAAAGDELAAQALREHHDSEQ